MGTRLPVFSSRRKRYGGQIVEPVIDLAKGAEQSELACALAESVRDHVHEGVRRELFLRLKGSYALVTSAPSSVLTLRFDFGRLTIHEGVVGLPDMTISGTQESIRLLTSVRYRGRSLLPSLRSASDREALGMVLRALRQRRIKVYGWWSHPRQLLRLARLFGADD